MFCQRERILCIRIAIRALRDLKKEEGKKKKKKLVKTEACISSNFMLPPT